MKKLICLALFIPFIFCGCNTKTQAVSYVGSEPKEETFIVTGVIAEKHHLYSTDIVVETDNGVKIPVYEGRYSDFSKGLEEGDRVSFKIKEVEGSGFEVVGLNF